jgi:hypothetical protein
MSIHSCSQHNNKQMGSYGYDKAFFEKNHISFVELKSSNNLSRLLVVPAYQGRVMTSTAGGDNGLSYGWINYSFIEAGKTDPQFNVYGGEERFWLGPEGGPFSIYFGRGVEQVYKNWKVPPVIDTESFDIVQLDARSVKLTREAELSNAHGTVFHLGISRSISLLTREDASVWLGVNIPEDLQMVAYETVNVITNKGEESWTRDKGLLSIWLLSMFNPSPETTVFIPYDPEGKGVVVHDEYFGKVPADRLIVEDSTVYFMIDGRYRSKIGIPPERARDMCGSYDSKSAVLTLLWCTLPAGLEPYVNSAWGDQDDPYSGDAINSYNDGPLEDGSIMGPFYEIETSSPAAELGPGESMKHVQKVAHLQGSSEELAGIVQTLFGLDLESIAEKFQ